MAISSLVCIPGGSSLDYIGVAGIAPFVAAGPNVERIWNSTTVFVLQAIELYLWETRQVFYMILCNLVETAEMVSWKS